MENKTAEMKRQNPGTIGVVVVLTLIAFGLIFQPRSSLYYPNVTVEAPAQLQLEFLLNGRKDRASCETAADFVAKLIRASCRDCRTRPSNVARH